MNHFDPTLWIAAIGAAIVRALTVPHETFVKGLLDVGVSVFCSWAFTNAVVDQLSLDPEIYTAPMSALIALTASGLVRALIVVSRDRNLLMTIIRTFWKR